MNVKDLNEITLILRNIDSNFSEDWDTIKKQEYVYYPNTDKLIRVWDIRKEKINNKLCIVCDTLLTSDEHDKLIELRYKNIFNEKKETEKPKTYIPRDWELME